MKKYDFSVMIKLIESIVFVLATHLSYYLAFLIRYQADYYQENVDAYLQSAPYISLVVLLVLIGSGYLNMLKKPMAESLVLTGIVAASVSVLVTFSAFYSRSFAFPRSIILIGFFVMLIVFSLTKLLVLKLILKFRQQKCVMIVVSRPLDDRFLNRVLHANHRFDNIKYIVYEDSPDLYTKLDMVNKVIVAESVNNDLKNRLITQCIGRDIKLYVVPTLFEIAQMNAYLQQMIDLPVYKMDSLILSSERKIVKRIFDLTLGTFFLLLSSPVIAVAALLIKLEDGGSPIYKQRRLTVSGKAFNVIKLRTMVQNAEKTTGAVLSSENDARITRIGRFIRNHRIDELPQFINVIKGDMSIVGPRPERPEFVEQYVKEIDGFEHRFLTKAGITGLAQIMGDYSTSASEKLKYDLIYLKNAHWLFDLKMIFLTVKVVVIGLANGYHDYSIPFAEYYKSHNLNLKECSYGYQVLEVPYEA